jgi:2-dehydro-3-deoxygalactonokinase
MIAINWGTSNFRAFRIGSKGTLEAEKTSSRGALSVPSGGFLDALMAEVGDWIRAGEEKVLMSGMVGARRGWKEVPYISVPATLEKVAGAVVSLQIDCLDARIVPGLIGADECGIPEVMRGEETEIFGCEGGSPSHSNLCLPGTHTKWVRMEDARIAAFTTCMTGDLYKAIREGSILRSFAGQDPIDDAAFLLGVARSRQAGALAHHLFCVRTLLLTARIAESSASSYLSGLLIGHEVKTMAREGESVHLIGDAALCSLYARALAEFDVQSSVEPAGADLRGLTRIAGRLEW